MHMPFHAQSEKHQKFLRSVLNKLELLNPSIDVTEEIQNLKNEIR